MSKVSRIHAICVITITRKYLITCIYNSFIKVCSSSKETKPNEADSINLASEVENKCNITSDSIVEIPRSPSKLVQKPKFSPVKNSNWLFCLRNDR